MPQNRSSCWEFCDYVRKGVIRCKFCHRSLSNNITRFKNHLLYKCSTPDDVKQRITAIVDKVSPSVVTTSSAAALSTAATVANGAGPSAKKKCILISDVGGPEQQIEVLQDGRLVIEEAKNLHNGNEGSTVLLLKNDYLLPTATTSGNNELTFNSIANRHKSFLSNDRLESMQRKFCKAVFESKCPFGMFGSKYWREFFEDICPDFKIPALRDIENKFMDHIYKEIQTGIINQIEDPCKISILLDLSIDSANKPVINVFLCSNRPYFYKSISLRAQVPDVALAESEIEELFNEIGVSRIVAVVAKTFEHMMSNEFQKKFPNIIFYRCCAYQLRLMTIEIIEVDLFKTVLNEVLQIISHVRTDSVIKNKFKTARDSYCKERKFRKISLKNFVMDPYHCPATTYKNVIKAKDILLTVANEPEFDAQIKLILEDETFWTKLEKHWEFFHEIAEVIRAISYMDACFSDVVYFMNNLQKRISNLLNDYEAESESVSIIKDLFKSRYDLIVSNCAVLSYILHPRYRLEGLQSTQIQEAELFLDNFLTNALPDDKHDIITGYQNYFLRLDLFNNPLYWKYEVKDPVNWWKRILKSKIHEKLSLFAIDLLNIKPTIFSIDKVNRHVSNRLSEEKQNQLNTISNHLRIDSTTNELDFLDNYESGMSDNEDQQAINETNYLLGLSQPNNGQESIQIYTFSINVDGQEEVQG